MTHSPADVLRWAIIALGLGVEPATRADGVPWPVVVGLEPSSPDDTVTLKNTVGMDDGRAMVTGRLYCHYGILIRVRAVDEVTGWQKADAIRTELAEQIKMTAVTVDSSTYQVAAVSHIGQVIPLGKESPSSKRNVFTLNVTAAIRQTS